MQFSRFDLSIVRSGYYGDRVRKLCENLGNDSYDLFVMLMYIIILFVVQNLKQKIVNLLRKFKATEEGHRGVETKTGGPTMGVGVDIDELFDELDGLSEDSEPDADTLSVGSFPKPVLPPFFASSRSLIQQSKL